MFLNILEQSLLFLPLTLGIFISYGVLKIADLTTDGTFVLGGALFATAVGWAVHPGIAMLFSILGGVLAGITSSLLQTKLRLNPLIAGILLVFIINTLTLKIMGKPNLSLFDKPSVFCFHSKIALLLPISLFFLIGLAGLLASRIGLLLHAFGNNPTLLHLCGKNSDIYRLLGLSLSNGLVAFSGALTAQAHGYADIGMGTGIILIALSTVIIGQQIYEYLFQKRFFIHLIKLLCCFLAILFYFSTVHTLLAVGIDPIYLRLTIGICLIAFLGITQEKSIGRLAT